MNDTYSPHTLEHIQTDNPAPWMMNAGIAAPDYNAQTQGCFWRDGAWSIEEAEGESCEDKICRYEKALDAHLDEVALSYRFGVNSTVSPRHSLAMRAGYPNQWQNLAIAFGTWMDSVNTASLQLLEDVKNEVEPCPTIEEFLTAISPFEYAE